MFYHQVYNDFPVFWLDVFFFYYTTQETVTLDHHNNLPAVSVRLIRHSDDAFFVNFSAAVMYHGQFHRFTKETFYTNGINDYTCEVFMYNFASGVYFFSNLFSKIMVKTAKIVNSWTFKNFMPNKMYVCADQLNMFTYLNPTNTELNSVTHMEFSLEGSKWSVSGYLSLFQVWQCFVYNWNKTWLFSNVHSIIYM